MVRAPDLFHFVKERPVSILSPLNCCGILSKILLCYPKKVTVTSPFRNVFIMSHNALVNYLILALQQTFKLTATGNYRQTVGA